MRKTYSLILISAIILAVPMLAAFQQSDASRSVAGGGISVPGWSGQIDASEAAKGSKLEDAKLSKDGDKLHITTGPAVAYWNSKNTAKGNYTVKATFNEPNFMNLNDHPHPYGIFIGGNDMGTDKQTYFYCSAYGSGKFIARGFGPSPFKLNERGTPTDAVHKAPAKGEPVTQDIAVSVAGDKVSCSINGTVVGTWPKTDVVGDGKIKSTDGIYGIRYSHNTEGFVTGLTMTKQ